MLIRTRLILIGLLPLLLFLLFIAGMMVTQLQLDSFREKAVFASHIEKNFFDLFVIAHDMKERNRFERSRQQWPPISRELGQQLSKAGGMFSSADEKELIETLLEYFEDSQRDFRELTQWLDQHQDRTLIAAQQAYLSSLSERLHISLQSAIPIANRIAAINQKNAVAFDNKRENALAFALVFIAGVLLLTLWPLMRGITRSVEQLKTGMSRVALGDLDSRIAMAGKDEFAQLARHFNEMISKLAEVTVARETLSAEVAERKRIEDALRYSEENLNRAQAVGQIGSWFLDIPANRLEWSAETYRMFGIPQQQAVDLETFVAAIHSDDRDLVLRAWDEAMSGATYDIEHRIVTGGQERWVRERARIERDPEGRPLIGIGTVEDITERKYARDALKHGAARIEMLLNSVAEGIYGVDMQGNCTFINSAGLHLLGYQEENELVGKHMHSLIHHTRAEGSRYPAAECRLYSCLQSHESTHVDDELFWRKDGSSFPVDYWSRPTMLNGEHGAVITFLDITERKRIIEELELFRLMVEKSGDPIFMIDDDDGCRMVYVNEAAIKHYGATREEILTWRIPDWDPNFTYEKLDEHVEEIKKLKNLTIESLHRVKGGQIVPVEITLNYMLYKKRLCHFGYFKNITDRKEHEEELKRSNADLEQFSYAVSHDMRQPLRMISSYLQLLELKLADQLDGEKRDYFDFAIEGAKRIDQMLVELLEYSRIGRMGEPLAWIESHKLLDEALQFLQPAIAEAQAKVSIEGEWPRILASHDEILRLLQNLIGNAIKYRITGRTPEITVTGEVVKNEWRLCIADNGVGIIPGQIKRLFQVFQRLQSREAYEGTGIGLALCRKIAEHHKGRIWAESAGEGQGSKFSVSLPVLREKA